MTCGYDIIGSGGDWQSSDPYRVFFAEYNHEFNSPVSPHHYTLIPRMLGPGDKIMAKINSPGDPFQVASQMSIGSMNPDAQINSLNLIQFDPFLVPGNNSVLLGCYQPGAHSDDYDTNVGIGIMDFSIEREDYTLYSINFMDWSTQIFLAFEFDVELP